MKTRIKFISFVLALFLCASSIFYYTYLFKAEARGISTAQNSEYNYIENSIKSVRIYDKAIKQFKHTEVFKTAESPTYCNDFGGAYIDDNGFLNIGVVSSNHYQLTSLQTNANFNGQVKYRPYTYSYNYLENVKEVLEEIMLDYDICGIGISEKFNHVFVELENKDTITKIIDYLQNLHLYKKEAIEFKVNSNYKIILTSTAYSGDYIGGGTIGANVIDSLTGNYGLITNQHVAELGETMYTSTGSEIGISSRGQTTGTIDAAFVPFSDQTSWHTTPFARSNTQIFNNIRIGSEDQIIEGQNIKRIGRTTKVTEGKITCKEKTISLQIDSSGLREITKTFEYDNTSKPGDSGGPVYYNDGTNLYLIGLNFATRLDDNNNYSMGYACRMSEIIRILDVFPITNDPIPLAIRGLNHTSGCSTPYWDIEIINYNNFSVDVTYNDRMCFENDGKYFRNLDINHKQTINIPSNSSKIVTIYENGFADHITAGINYTANDGSECMIISYANEISTTGNNLKVNPITISVPVPETPPDYLEMEVIATYGWIWRDWDIKLINSNDSPIQVTYNQRMCFQGDARDFINLSDTSNITISGNSSIIVRINSNGTADYITAAINYNLSGNNYRRVTYANEIYDNPLRLTSHYNQIRL